MNKKLIIEMANKSFDESSFTDAEVLRFAKLVAEHEREQCAKDCESINSVEDFYGERPELICAGAIRARGNP